MGYGPCDQGFFFLPTTPPRILWVQLRSSLGAIPNLISFPAVKKKQPLFAIQGVLESGLGDEFPDVSKGVWKCVPLFPNTMASFHKK